jgi:diguanylate cyclase (GGDEF)-like protein
MLRSAGAVLAEAGYVCIYFDDLISAFAEVYNNAPHFVIFDALEERFDLKKAFLETRSQLPETHMFLMSPLDKRGFVSEFFAAGLYDVLWTPPASSREWVRAIDRASERDYYMYMNEQLQKAEAEKSDMGRLMELHRSLQKRTGMQECIQDFLEFGSRLLGDCGAIYLKSVPMRKILSATHGHNVENWKGIGVNLANESHFTWEALQEPQNVSAIREMIKEVYSRSDFQAFTFKIAKDVNGIAIFLAHRPMPESLGTLSLAREFVQTSAGLLESEKRLHSLSIRDEVTGVLNRNYFIERATGEVLRARRSHLPLSVLFITVDQHEAAVQKGGLEEGNSVLRILARVFGKHSRVNDLVARYSPNEFAILLPDTNLAGGAIKAERLRRMIEGGDFSRVLQHTPQLTISAGVSEYPSVCRDVEELFERADEALVQVKAKTNRVCLARPPNSFTPDFVLPEDYKAPGTRKK